ncbi:class B sortase [Blautia sp. MSJ-19]|uniref:class B sortase n=1 Tax=Blautia sp. MSJ-19 TaxID=2841517 RepID=UPI001C0E9823|nr:class B sortase [Blautia sp. MSJ-19]MBU5479801.1 class B sortase [Blautia sp. MSJ-19]
MKVVILAAKAGDRLISLVAGVLVVVMLLYGGYSLWDTAMLYRGAFVSGDLIRYKPSVSEGDDGASLEELCKLNPDVRGWLTIDGTHIDYPVVQGQNDMEYVNKDVYGEFALSGSIFMDSQNAGDFSDSYTLLYGHHMANGAMFGDVTSFTEQKYFQEHQTGRLFFAEGGSAEITLYACVETDAYDRKFYHPESREISGMKELLDYIRKNAVQYRDIGIKETDSLIGLSTCMEAETNGRVIVFGRLEKEKQVNQT